VLTCSGTCIAFDPIFENPFSRNCHAFPDVRFDLEQIKAQRFDAVFISHFHDDHCSLESLDLLARDTPIYLYCLYDELFEMVRALGFTQVHALRVNDSVHIGPFAVTPRLALDPEVDSLFQIEAAGLKILNVVDSWIDPSALELLASAAPWDMVLWPFQTMREIAVLAPSRATPAAPTLPQEWMEQLQRLNPRYVVPSSCQFLQESWSWYNRVMFPVTYRQFAQEVTAALPMTQVVRFDPSVSMTLDASGLQAAPPLGWVQPVGAQDLDFQFDPAYPVPPTADIARRFDALDAQQSALVLDYCRHGLLEKYRSMELDPDSYFAQPRLWQLSLYDHAGGVRHFRYRLQGDAISMADDSQEALGWRTELAAAKLYAGLARGESLSSMYMRINDMVFDAATEADLADADIVDDPLIRCLFNDNFGAYQAAQLRRLQRRPAC
jgi:hypothetical protein